ncbi:unnamed protein product [Cyprideis torosa]|uniref:Uncharacterized protein n=1 Tax=Cyprideis torosa TaxID=163714 RepID=A0A7R8WHT2_9CRUS|nr:unnamed protein product [Cyprideis torosa]CAG0897878.1 unnamed protein product [Cyprideis torosa]
MRTPQCPQRVMLKEIEKKTKAPVIVALPENAVELSSQIMAFSPFFCVTLPYDTLELRIVVKRALEKVEHYRLSSQKTEAPQSFCGIVGNSSSMRSLFQLIRQIADDDISTVLIRGESGTGKELVARAIHTSSSRKSKNFVPVNCAAIPDDLLESELFGYAKGAFTGANQSKQGRIQYADGGTLFLDEIGDMKPNLQAKLLRVLQEKEFEPVGGLKPTPVDTRVLAATHCDLEELVSKGQFREDLYYRLSVIPVQIPPLKKRRGDIPLLIRQFKTVYSTERGREPFSFSDQALESLLRYRWKGNVRELENLIQHMSILHSGKTVSTSDLPEKYREEKNLCPREELVHSLQESDLAVPSEPQLQETGYMDDLDLTEQEIDLKDVLDQFETKLILKALQTTGGNKKEAARLLKLKRTTLLEKIKKKKLSPNDW